MQNNLKMIILQFLKNSAQKQITDTDKYVIWEVQVRKEYAHE